MTADLRPIVADERRVLDACCAVADFIVDVPIDLRPLLDAINPESEYAANYYWQLVRRPIDQALGGLKPLADFIGYPVARIANLRRGFKNGSQVELNRTLFETYPAANLELIRGTNEPVRRVYDKYRWISGLKATEPRNWQAWLLEALKGHVGDALELSKNERRNLVALVLNALGEEKSDAFSEAVKRGLQAESIMRVDKPPYKGGMARFRQPRWVAKRKDLADQCLAELLNALGFTASTGDDTFDADEFDSAMCSIVGCFPECTMPHANLKQTVRERLTNCGTTEGIANALLVPIGYRVLSTWPENLPLVLKTRKFEDAEALCAYLQTNRTGSAIMPATSSRSLQR